MVSTPVESACPLLPGEYRLDVRVLQDRRAVELRRHGVPNSAPALCVLQLACEVGPADVRNVSYALRRGSILAGDIAAVHFQFLDGQTQSCTVTEIQVPE
jgi:hypothetical protein